MDLFTFLERTDGFEKSFDLAIKFGLLPEKKSRRCIKCEREGSLKWSKNCKVINVPFIFVCGNRSCRTTIAISRNTLFQHLTFSISKALRLIYFWLMKLSVNECASQLQLPESTIDKWFEFFREICAFSIINYTKAIGGPGHAVDLTEYQFLPCKAACDKWLFTGVDRSTGENFALHVENLDGDTLWPAVKNYIMPGTLVMTDRFREFNELEGGQFENQPLKFVEPKKRARSKNNHSLDELWNRLNEYVERETPENHRVCKELYAYQFLYFNRDDTCEKSASELIAPFLRDAKLAYPGFEKMDKIEEMQLE